MQSQRFGVLRRLSPGKLHDSTLTALRSWAPWTARRLLDALRSKIYWLKVLVAGPASIASTGIAAVPDRRCAGGTGWRRFCFLTLGRPDNALRGHLHSTCASLEPCRATREVSTKHDWLVNLQSAVLIVKFRHLPLCASAVEFGRDLTCYGSRFLVVFPFCECVRMPRYLSSAWSLYSGPCSAVS